MVTILAGLPQTKCYLDDILMCGSTLELCHQNVLNVIKRLNEYNIMVNERKYKFYNTNVEFLGHIIKAEGIYPIEEKLVIIKCAPQPQNLTQLKSYLNCYRKFIPVVFYS